MPTPEELLEKLEERLILGEISEPMYHDLKAKLEAKLGRPSGGGSMSISDSVIKGDVSNTTGAASVGNVVFNIPGAAPGQHAPPSLVTCPLCGRRNRPESVFRCMKCGNDHLCLDHFVASARMCEDCVAKDEALLAEAERKRQAEAQAQAEREIADRAAWKAEQQARWKVGEGQAILKSIELDCGGGVAMKLVLISAGEFMMGSPDSDVPRDLKPENILLAATDDEKPRHKVSISRPFYMGVYPVTQAQYEAVMGENPSDFYGPETPVEEVSWQDAEAFCVELGDRVGREVRLPTEAEWEYACRAGTTTRYCFGDDEKPLLGATRGTVATPQAARPSWSVARSPMPGACTTCTAT